MGRSVPGVSARQKAASVAGSSWALRLLRWSDNYDAESCVVPPSILRSRPCNLNTNTIEDPRLIAESPSLHLDEISVDS